MNIAKKIYWRLYKELCRGDFWFEGYRALYPDIPNSRAEAWRHYVLHGKNEGRSNGVIAPEDMFFAEGYKALYPDVATEADVWRHYVLAGKAEGRCNGLLPPEDVFFADGYLELYPDVAQSGMNPWRHYILAGKAEGRGNGLVPSEDVFFADGYLELYPDVAQSGMNPWRHYVLAGKAEGRCNGLVPPEDVFFSDGYLELYPDVAQSGMNPWKHYVLHGKTEGKDDGRHPPLDVFFAEGYKTIYQDIEDSGVDPWRHYVLTGKAEGYSNGWFPPEDVFFADGYLDMYPDVAQSGMNPWQHYALYGKAEGRLDGHFIPWQNKPDVHPNSLKDCFISVDSSTSGTKYKYDINIKNINDPRVLMMMYIKDKEDIQILDCGCACGDQGVALKHLFGAHITGLEYDNDSIAVAMMTGCYDEIFQCNLDELRLDTYPNFKEKFDYIICGDILEHLRNPYKTLEILSSYLNPDGRLLASIPNIAHTSVIANLLLNDFEYTKTGLLDATHIHFFTYKTIASGMAENGWLIEDVRYTLTGKNGFQTTNPYPELPDNINKFLFNNFHYFVCQYVIIAKKSNLDSNTLHENNISLFTESRVPYFFSNYQNALQKGLNP